MTHISIEGRGVRAQFLKDEQNQPSIQFFDPSYARAEVVLYNHSTREMHALLHEGMYLIGQVPQDLEQVFGASDNVMLCADHFSGHKIGLRAKLSQVS